MNEFTRELKPFQARKSLPIILLAAVFQGWALYGLHWSIKQNAWPATNDAWLMALYAVVIFVPLTAQLLAAQIHQSMCWRMLLVLGGTCFYFGWHYGQAVDGSGHDYFFQNDIFASGLVCWLWWLLVLPFLQSRLHTDRWWPQYGVLFSTAWRNKLILLQAALFTGLYWLLLTLWQNLFAMLGILDFRELFAEPIFVYPTTALSFGLALHFIGSLERFTVVVIEQILNVFKWLAVLTGLILALFSIALIAKFPALVFSGQHAIDAAWLLWLVAVMVLLLNAAYRDGTGDTPYPYWLAQALRFVVPLMVLCVVTALYALWLRTHQYGFTVARLWGWVVAVIALLYAVGYSIAAFKVAQSKRWLQGVGQINILVALVLIVILTFMLTPILSPYRLAANSQYKMILQTLGNVTGLNDNARELFKYLRFDAGQYGRDKLKILTTLHDHPNATLLREAAQSALGLKTRWNSNEVTVDIATQINRLEIYPAGRVLDVVLQQQLQQDLHAGRCRYYFGISENVHKRAGLFVDLTDDGKEEFVLISDDHALAYQQAKGSWMLVGVAARYFEHNYVPIDVNKLRDGIFKTVAPRLRDLYVGEYRFQFTDVRGIETSCRGDEE